MRKAAPDFPVFVLAFCIFEKDVFAAKVTPKIQELKFRYFGHDMVVLHEREIRKRRPPFEFLNVASKRERFFDDLNKIMLEADFRIVSVVIDKRALSPQQRDSEDNIYHIAARIGLDSVYAFLADESPEDAARDTHFIFESRGKKEDAELELEFRRICDDRDGYAFRIIIANKQINSCGLQLADLVARPIGRHVIDPNQENRAFEILSEKLWHRNENEQVYVFP